MIDFSAKWIYKISRISIIKAVSSNVILDFTGLVMKGINMMLNMVKKNKAILGIRRIVIANSNSIPHSLFSPLKPLLLMLNQRYADYVARVFIFAQHAS